MARIRAGHDSVCDDRVTASQPRAAPAAARVLAQEGRGSEYVDKSEMILIFISDGYFSSPNCMRELLRAMHMKKPLLTLMESERRKGALTREEVRMRLKEANENYAKWGLADEMDAWRFPQPSAQQLYDVIFGAREPIEWNRLGIFQDVTLRQIADATLQATLPDTQGKTYLQGELVSQMAEVLKRPSSSYHIYKSQHNPGVDELLKELATWSGTKMVSTPTRRQASMAHLPSPTGSPDPRRSVRRDIGEEESSVVRIRKGVSSLVGNIGAKLKSQPLRVASSPDQLAECDHFLCYLNGRTWTSGETSAAFASEVRAPGARVQTQGGEGSMPHLNPQPHTMHTLPSPPAGPPRDERGRPPAAGARDAGVWRAGGKIRLRLWHLLLVCRGDDARRAAQARHLRRDRTAIEGRRVERGEHGAAAKDPCQGRRARRRS